MLFRFSALKGRTKIARGERSEPLVQVPVFASGTLDASRVLLIANPVATVLAAGGYTKETLIEDLTKNARAIAYEFAFIQTYGSFGAPNDSFEGQLEKNLKRKDAEKGKLPEWYGRFPGWEEVVTIPAMAPQYPGRASNSRILVCGDPFRNKVQTLAGTFDFSPVKMELPEKWDELTAKLGYKPLKSFYL